MISAVPLAKKEHFSPLPSAWVTANAGSGKTTALIERVLKLLFIGVAPERILCLTYTKAAASEMRTRLVDKLRSVLMMTDAECAALYQHYFQLTATPEMIAHARGLFISVLDSPTGGVELTTIHGFCQRLLRAFPLEAGITPYFSVLEDSEVAVLLQRASQRILQESKDATLTQALELVIARAAEQRFTKLSASILQDRHFWARCWRGQTPQTLREHLFQLHALTPHMTAERLYHEFSADALTHRAAHNSCLASLREATTKQAQVLAEALAHWLSASSDPKAIESLVKALVTETHQVRDWIQKSKALPSVERETIITLGQRAVRLRLAQAALACAEESYAIAIIARALLDDYQILKTQRGAFDYDDLIAHTLMLLTTREMTAWVMSKLDHRIDHLLVDEAQDTSAGQWAIVQALVDDLIQSGAGSAWPRSLFVVGDEKQSIFGFQGAAPELFDRQRHHYAELLSHSDTPLQALTLDTSYRSAPVILQLVDQVMADPRVARSVTAAGQHVPHRAHRAQAAGMVALYPLIEVEQKRTLPPFTIPQHYQITRTPAQRLADHVATRIHQWLAAQRSNPATGAPITPSDILVLVHRRRPMMPCLIRALQRVGIPVSGMDRLIIGEHLAVQDILALIRWCFATHDDLALAQVLRSPLLDVDEDTLCALAAARDGASLWERVQQLPHYATRLEQWHAQRHTTAYAFLTSILDISETRTAFVKRFGEEIHEVLDELLEQAAQYQPEQGVPLRDFEAFITASDYQIKREMDARDRNEVRIMTVHGAKGLEAPIVLLVDTLSVPDLRHEQTLRAVDAHQQSLPVIALSQASKSAPAYVAARQQRQAALHAEYYRLLYVALTRAREELHILGAGDADEDSWYAICRHALGDLYAQADEEGVLRFAGENSAIPSKPLSYKNISIAPPAWLHQPVVSPLRQQSIAPSQLAGDAPAAAVRFITNDAKERGVRIHRVLQYLDATSDAEHVAALVRFIAPDWDAKIRAEITREIEALRSAYAWVWQDGQAEVSVSGMIPMHTGMTLFHGQIDRLVRLPESVVVLDYKTSRQVPLSAAEVPSSYLYQLKAYAALVAQLYPHMLIQTAILWTHTPTLMWLTEATEALSWPDSLRKGK